MDKNDAQREDLSDHIPTARDHFHFGLRAFEAKKTGEALQWFGKAALAGDVNAIHCLGVIHYEGAEGVPVNRKKGKIYLALAAKNGCLESLLYLAEDRLEAKRFGPALRMLNKISNTDSAELAPRAQFHLGILMLKGLGTRKNIAEGMEMLWRAADAGHGFAKCALAEEYLDENRSFYDRRLAKKLLDEARRDGIPDANLMLRSYFPSRRNNQLYYH